MSVGNIGSLAILEVVILNWRTFMTSVGIVSSLVILAVAFLIRQNLYDISCKRRSATCVGVASLTQRALVYTKCRHLWKIYENNIFSLKGKKLYIVLFEMTGLSCLW